MYKAYIFDFDYTLANSEKELSCALKDSLPMKDMALFPKM